MNRRLFLTQSLTAAALVRANAQGLAQAPVPTIPEPKRPAALDPNLVRAFVGAGHRDLPKVQQLLREVPNIANASWDWGGGDWETSLGAASHVGRREIALHLLEAGARIDAFSAAMLGEADIIVSLMRLSPAAANVRGPHGHALLYHAGYSGSVRMAEAIGPHLTARTRDCNRALQTASLAGHAEFVDWLLKNGADNPNTKDFSGQTPLDLAITRGHETVVKLLRANGGLTSL